MTVLDKLIADEFQKLQPSGKTNSSIFYQMRDAHLARLQEENAELKKEIAYLEPYQRLLTEPLYGWLLHGRVTIEELALEVRMASLTFTYAWRYAEAKHDATYGNFLKLQEAHKALFDEYIGDIEDNRDWVSLL